MSSSAPAESEEEWAFAGAIVALGRTLGLTIIAEGIEEAGQFRRLYELGCGLGQGFLFAEPQPADAITRMLEEGHSLFPAPTATAAHERSASGGP